MEGNDKKQEVADRVVEYNNREYVNKRVSFEMYFKGLGDKDLIKRFELFGQCIDTLHDNTMTNLTDSLHKKINKKDEEIKELKDKLKELEVEE